jgi:hypothetical protein
MVREVGFESTSKRNIRELRGMMSILRHSKKATGIAPESTKGTAPPAACQYKSASSRWGTSDKVLAFLGINQLCCGSQTIRQNSAVSPSTVAIYMHWPIGESDQLKSAEKFGVPQSKK